MERKKKDMSTDYKKIAESISKHKTKSKKAAEKFVRFLPLVSCTNEGRSPKLKIERDTMKFRIQRAWAFTQSWRGFIYFSIVIGTLTCVAIAETEYPDGLRKFYLSLTDAYPAIATIRLSYLFFWLFLLAGALLAWFLISNIMVFLMHYTKKHSNASRRCSGPLHLALIEGKKYRIWKDDPEDAFECKRKDLEIEVWLYKYEKPYGLGMVKISGYTIPDPGSLTEKKTSFSYLFVLPEHDVKTILAFKHKNRIEGEQTTLGSDKVYRKLNDGQMSLARAAEKGDIEKTQKLLDIGFDPDIMPSHGFPALIAAAKYGHVKVMELLLKNGADPNICDSEGMNASYYISEKYKEKEIEEIFPKEDWEEI